MWARQGEDWEGGGVGHTVFLVSCNIPLYDPVSQAPTALSRMHAWSQRVAGLLLPFFGTVYPCQPHPGQDQIPPGNASWQLLSQALRLGGQEGGLPRAGFHSCVWFCLGFGWHSALNQRMEAVGLHCAWWSGKRSQAPAVAPRCLARSLSLAPDNGQACPLRPGAHTRNALSVFPLCITGSQLPGNGETELLPWDLH